MGEMVERVARAICDAANGTVEDDRGVEHVECTCEPGACLEPKAVVLARAAIAAMRAPTEAMIIAGVRFEIMGDMAGRYQEMIDRALKD